MALIQFKTMLEHLQNPYSLLTRLLSGQERLHYTYGDMCYMPMQHTLMMQCMPYHYFIYLA